MCSGEQEESPRLWSEVECCRHLWWSLYVCRDSSDFTENTFGLFFDLPDVVALHDWWVISVRRQDVVASTVIVNSTS